jgi:hypothetical protein
MISCHPRVKLSGFEQGIDIAIKDAGLIGYVSRDTLKEFFKLFSWVYVQGDVSKAFKENTKLKQFLSRFDLFRFKGPSLCYSAVLFYQKLSRVIDMRKLELGDLCTMEAGANKLFFSEDFSYKELYKLYAENPGDLSTDFLLFNELFKNTQEKQVKKISACSELSRRTDITALVRPDLGYNLALKKLDVNYQKESSVKEEKKIYILQDSTHSMVPYEGQLKMIKAFILEAAFKNDYQVEWLFISDRVNFRVLYNKANIATTEIRFYFSGIRVDTTKILVQDELLNKQVVIITDGTDSFNFPINTKTKKINVISFLDNINIKDKISTYGRFFKVSL